MPLASTSRVQLRYIKESTFGVIPVTGNPKELRVTGESLNYTVNKEMSAEINSSRGTTSMVPVSAESGGTLNAELSYAEYDELLSATLQDPWTVYGTNGVSTSFSATITATTITAAVAPTTTSAFTNLRAGQWFTLTGTGTANDNKLFRVSKVTAPTSTVITLDVGTPGIAGGPFATTVLRTSRLTNGVTQPSYTIERESADTSEFFAYTGQTASSMSLNVATGALTTLEFTFLGKDVAVGTTTRLPGTPVASQAYQIMSGAAGTSCALWYKGTPLTGTFVTSIALSYDNALRAQNAICSLGAVDIGSGTINATIDLEIYFASGRAFFAEFLSNANSELAFTAFDVEGNGYVFTLPKVNVSSYTVNAGGKDDDLMASISLTALLDNANAVAALRKVMFIDRIGAAVTP
jgi:hypothetical protein